MRWDVLLESVLKLVWGMLLIVIGNIVCMGFPFLKLQWKQKKKTFLIEKENYAEKQGKIECSGYSSAFVYRHLGKNVTGEQLYKEMPCKNSEGAYVKGIVRLARRYGFHARLRTGNITALKNTIAKGIPVIVMVRTKLKASVFHYIPVVGYDEEYFYVMESIAGRRNEDNLYYNRKIPVKEFRKLWNIRAIKRLIVLSNLFVEIRE